MCGMLGKTIKRFANMIALGAEENRLITHDENCGWELSGGELLKEDNGYQLRGSGGLLNAVVTLYVTIITG